MAGNTSQTACGAWLLRVLQQRDRHAEDLIETAGNKPQDAGRQARNDRPLDAIEVGPARLPVLRVPGDSDPLVWPEFDEFERAARAWPWRVGSSASCSRCSQSCAPQQRCSRVVGHTSPRAFQNPSAPSATAIRGAVFSPRRFATRQRSGRCADRPAVPSVARHVKYAAAAHLPSSPGGSSDSAVPHAGADMPKAAR